MEEKNVEAKLAWWTMFQDPALEALIRSAHEQNLSLQIAAVRFLEARAQLGVATGALYPQTQTVSAGAGYVRDSKHSANSFGADANFWSFDLGFDVAISEQQYRAGMVDYTRVLDSQTARAAPQDRYIASRGGCFR